MLTHRSYSSPVLRLHTCPSISLILNEHHCLSTYSFLLQGFLANCALSCWLHPLIPLITSLSRQEMETFLGNACLLNNNLLPCFYVQILSLYCNTGSVTAAISPIIQVLETNCQGKKVKHEFLVQSWKGSIL